MKKVVHVHLKQPFNDKADFYFSSFKAIFETIPKDVLHCGCAYLTDAARKRGGHFENKYCVVNVDRLLSSTRNAQP